MGVSVRYEQLAGEWAATVPDPYGEDHLVVAPSRGALLAAVREVIRFQGWARSLPGSWADEKCAPPTAHDVPDGGDGRASQDAKHSP